MPIRPPRPCTHCHQLGAWDRHGRCPSCNQSHNAARNSQPNRRQYADPQYRRNRLIVLERDRWCYRCGAPSTTADHIIPISRGGTNHLNNLRGACLTCNSARGNRPG